MEKSNYFPYFLNRYKWIITSTNNRHFDTWLRQSLTSWMFRFVRTVPLFRHRNPLPNSLLGKTFVRIRTCSEFCTENCKNFLFIFSFSTELWVMGHDYERPYFYLYFCISYIIFGLSRAKNKTKLANLVIVSFASARSFAKWLNVPSNGVCQVTVWKRVAILMNWCDGEVRDCKSDEFSWWSVAKWSIRQARSSKFENLWVRRVNFTWVNFHWRSWILSD